MSYGAHLSNFTRLMQQACLSEKDLNVLRQLASFECLPHPLSIELKLLCLNEDYDPAKSKVVGLFTTMQNQIDLLPHINNADPLLLRSFSRQNYHPWRHDNGQLYYAANQLPSRKTVYDRGFKVH